MSEYTSRPLPPCERLLAIPLMELTASTVATWNLPGLPSGTLDVPECRLVMCGTADAERRDLAMLKTAVDQDRDVLLLRLLAGKRPCEADIVLSSPVEPMLLTHMLPCRFDQSLWLVPMRGGRYVSVEESGLKVHWQPPASEAEIFAGCQRADTEIARFLKGVSF
ncbi:hypothetical protein ACIGGE_15320 [Qipengyuania sp. NPDC077410]|uniref:hypothetical protein n=1 Tax=Qipengyuania sp. NPDC077410 TaxID=3364496 RepID=UPI0037CBFAEA